MTRWSLDPIDVLFAHPAYGPMTVALFVDGPVDEERLHHAYRKVVGANPILATRVVEERGRLAFVPRLEPALLDEVALPEEAWDARHDPNAWVGQVPELAPADQGPLVRLRLLTMGRRAALITNMAHCLGDGVAMLLMLCEVARAYHGGVPRTLPCDRAGLATAIRALPAGGRARPGHSGLAEKERVTEDAMVRWPVEAVPEAALDAVRAAHPALSRFEVLAAYVAAERFRRRPAAAFSIAVPINFRGLIPGLPANYFGNALKAELLSLDVGALAAGDVAAVALAIHEARRAVDRLAFRDSYEQLAALYAAAGPAAVARLRVSSDDALVVTDMTALPDAIAFDGHRPCLVSFLSRYQNTAVLSRADERTMYQLGARRDGAPAPRR